MKQKLEVLDADRYRGALVRARADQLAAGGTPTKRALGLEKAHARRNLISEIEWKRRVVTKKEDIQNAFFEFYLQLFARRKVDLEGFKK